MPTLKHTDTGRIGTYSEMAADRGAGHVGFDEPEKRKGRTHAKF